MAALAADRCACGELASKGAAAQWRRVRANFGQNHSIGGCILKGKASRRYFSRHRAVGAEPTELGIVVAGAITTPPK